LGSECPSSAILKRQKTAKMAKKAKNGPQLTSLISPTILELEKSL